MKKKILLIEDEEYLRSLLSQALISKGFEVEGVIDAEEGLEKLKKGLNPDLILLDLLLPGKINGYDFLSIVKKDSNFESIPVVIASNLGQAEEIEKGFNLGATDYLVKTDFSLDEIVEKIKKHL